MRTIESSRRGHLSALAVICLLALGFSFYTTLADASTSLRFGLDYRYIETTFHAYKYDDHRKVTNIEWADVIGIRGEFSKRWSLSETAAVGLAPGLSVFFLGNWETYGGSSGTLTGDVDIGAEIALPVEFAFYVNDKIEVGCDLGLAFSAIGFQEPSGIQGGSERDCYEGGIGWTLFDLLLGVRVGYRLTDDLGVLLRYRFSGAALGGSADYLDEPYPENLTNGGPQLLFDYRFGK